MHRFYIPPTAVSDGCVSIKGEAAGRICRVLRLRPGALVSVFDGSGAEWEVSLKLFKSSEVTGKIISVKTGEERDGLRVFIGQGLPKSLKMDMIVQKATELGVHSVIPVKMERCIVKTDRKKAENRVIRWRKISVEASEQCGRRTLPVISPPVSVEEFCEMVHDADLKILLWEMEEKVLLKSYMENSAANPLKIAVLIGPEGGISEKEAEGFSRHGFQAVGIGGYILRTETVALTVLSIIQFYYGCVGGRNG